MKHISKGFTLIELVVALALAALAVTAVLTTFPKLNSRQALETSAELVVSVLNEARSLTLSSSGGEQYGVDIQASQVVLFHGATYSSGASDNVVTPLNALVAARSITLAGGGTSVVFNRLTGATAKSGTLELYLKDATTTTRLITITATGGVESN